MNFINFLLLVFVSITVFQGIKIYIWDPITMRNLHKEAKKEFLSNYRYDWDKLLPYLKAHGYKVIETCNCGNSYNGHDEKQVIMKAGDDSINIVYFEDYNKDLDAIKRYLGATDDVLKEYFGFLIKYVELLENQNYELRKSYDFYRKAYIEKPQMVCEYKPLSPEEYNYEIEKRKNIEKKKELKNSIKREKELHKRVKKG